MNPLKVSIIGAGLAGCEAAYQLSKAKIYVDLYEQKPLNFSSAHTLETFSELVCSNSLRSDSTNNAVGILKQELRKLDSLIMKAADANKIPAGSSLAVDRLLFSEYITKHIKNNQYINVITKEVDHIIPGPLIIASGPLTSEKLINPISKLLNSDSLYFYDAIAPIIEKDSINFDIAYYKSRYSLDKDYINCPMTKDQFNLFYDYLIKANTIKLKDFEKEIYFEGCMPIEVMAKRGRQTLLFGPLKPVGLEYNDKKPFAVIQLRQDNIIDTMYNIVGFQTNLTYSEQKNLIKLIPGLENANIIRYGIMHKNTYINAPKLLENTYQLKDQHNIFIAGQLSGVEGYVESTSSGLLAGINMALYIKNKPLLTLNNETIIGSMITYISNSNNNKFQPMNANFGICKFNTTIDKSIRKQDYYNNSIKHIDNINKYLKDTIYN